MRRLLLSLLLLPVIAAGDISLQLAVNFDDTLSSAHPAGDKPEPDPNTAPQWVNTPTPGAVEGIGGTYSLLTDCTDVNDDTLTFTWNSGSAARPTGVDISGSNITDDGSASAGTTTGLIVDCDDGTADPVASSAFSYVVSDDAQTFTAMGACDSILPGICVHGLDWDTYLATDPDIDYRFVSNRNTSGAGSFNAAVSNCTGDDLKVVMPTVSGMVVYPDNSADFVDCNNLMVLMQTAPSPGMHFRGLKTVQTGSRQLWMHVSAFADSDIESQAGGFQFGSNSTSNSDVVFVNYGCAFNMDSCVNVWKNFQRGSYFQGMAIYPTDLDNGENPEIAYLGVDGSSSNITFARNVAAHFSGRCPRWAGRTLGTVANNVCYNGTNNWTHISHVHVTGMKWNILSNLYITGANGKSGLPIRIPQLAGELTEDMDAAIVGNRSLGWTDTTQTLLIDSTKAAGHLNVLGSPIAAAQNTGFVATAIGAGTAGERAFAVDIVCPNAGPRPNDQLTIYSDICDQLANKFDGSTPLGASIGPASDIGYPSLANNSCDPLEEDDCGSGMPALPPEGTVTVEQLLDYVMESHCARMPEGATGC